MKSNFVHAASAVYPLLVLSQERQSTLRYHLIIPTLHGRITTIIIQPLQSHNRVYGQNIQGNIACNLNLQRVDSNITRHQA